MWVLLKEPTGLYFKIIWKAFHFLTHSWFRTSLAPGTRRRRRHYNGGKEALGKLGNTQFSGHDPKRLCPALVCLSTLSCAEQAFDLAFDFEENFLRNRYVEITSVIIQHLPRAKASLLPQHSLGLNCLLFEQQLAELHQFLSVQHKLPTAPLSNRFQVLCSIWTIAIVLLKCSKEGHTGTWRQSLLSPCVLAW